MSKTEEFADALGNMQHVPATYKWSARWVRSVALFGVRWGFESRSLDDPLGQANWIVLSLGMFELALRWTLAHKMVMIEALPMKQYGVGMGAQNTAKQ